jgi:hypothetical protein
VANLTGEVNWSEKTGELQTGLANGRTGSDFENRDEDVLRESDRDGGKGVRMGETNLV